MARLTGPNGLPHLSLPFGRLPFLLGAKYRRAAGRLNSWGLKSGMSAPRRVCCPVNQPTRLDLDNENHVMVELRLILPDVVLVTTQLSTGRS